MDLNKILDSSNLAFSTAQKVCKWVAFALFALYVIVAKMYAGAILPEFWLGIVGVVALVLLSQKQTFRVGVCFAYGFFALFGVLWILFFVGAFDESTLQEVLISISNEQGINAQAVPVVTTLGACALILLTLIAFILTWIQKFASKIPSIFLGFLVLAPLVYLAPEPLYATLFPQKYYESTEKVSSQDEITQNPLPLDFSKFSKPISDEIIKSMPKSPKGFKYFPQDKIQLQALVNDFSIDLGDIDTSAITSMAFLFQYSMRPHYNGLEKWDTSSVRDMKFMFRGAAHFDDAIHFIDKWDTSKVEDMDYMFADIGGAELRLDKWDTSSVTSMRGMFSFARYFNSPIDKWNVTKVKDMSKMFYGADEFAQDLNKWKVRKDCNTTDMFMGALYMEENPPLWFVNMQKRAKDSAQKAVDDIFALNLSGGAKSPDKLTPTLLENALNVIYKDGDYRLHNANDYYKKISDEKIAKLKKAYELAKKPDKAQMIDLKQSILQSCTEPNPCTAEKEFEPEEFELEQLAGLHYGIDYLSLTLISSGDLQDKYFEEALNGLRKLGFPMWLDDDTPTRSIALYFYGLQILSYVDDESPAYKAIYNESKKDFAQFKKVLESKDYENLKGFLE
ncbi:BspA family leucine-rich repeat surface protein [Helicobacter sp. T3_23-1056]